MDKIELEKIFNLHNTKMSGDNLMASCPFADEFHNKEDRHQSFGINIYTGEYNCYVCGDMGTRGKSLESLAVKLNISLPKKFYKDILNMRLKTVNHTKEKKMVKQYMKDILSKNPDLAYEYLKERGVSLETIKKMKVGRHNVLDTLYFLDIDENGELIGWAERNEAWAGRYGFGAGNRKEMLFGLNKKVENAFLVEGPIDAMKLVDWGYTGIATYGNRIFEAQAERLIRLCKRIILVPDQDEGSVSWLNGADRFFKKKIQVYKINLTKAKDTGDKKYTKKLFDKDKKNAIFLY